ncbi:MAG: DUF86 domain-containing protein [Acetobacteraceae bacterium]|nr:DUF86 domain-containing protein [Acetobacteraceae bacterium]
MLYHTDVVQTFVAGVEASRRLPDDVRARHPEIAWKAMAGAGNIYHDCDDVAARRVWDTVQVALPPLRAVIQQELAASPR